MAAGRLRGGETHEVLDEVVEGDGLGEGAHPAGRDHDGQVVDEVADDLEGGGARADDDPRADLGDGHGAGAQHVARLAAGGEVGGGHPARLQPAEVNDALHAGGLGGLARVLSGPAVALGEVRAGGHRVHEVVDGVDAREGGGQGVGVEGVGLRKLDAGPLASLQRLEPPSRGPDGVSRRQQPGYKVAADVAGCAQNQDPTHLQLLPPESRRCLPSYLSGKGRVHG